MIEREFRVRCDHQGCTRFVHIQREPLDSQVAATRMALSNTGWEQVRRSDKPRVLDFCPQHAGNGRTDWQDSIRALADLIEQRPAEFRMSDIVIRLRDMIEEDDD